jgi:hypothetical protein
MMERTFNRLQACGTAISSRCRLSAAICCRSIMINLQKG